MIPYQYLPQGTCAQRGVLHPLSRLQTTNLASKLLQDMLLRFCKYDLQQRKVVHIVNIRPPGQTRTGGLSWNTSTLPISIGVLQLYEARV